MFSLFSKKESKTKHFVHAKQHIVAYLNNKNNNIADERKFFLNNLYNTILSVEEQVSIRLSKMDASKCDVAMKAYLIENEFCSHYAENIINLIEIELKKIIDKNNKYNLLLNNIIKSCENIKENCVKIKKTLNVSLLNQDLKDTSFLYHFCELFNGVYQYFDQAKQPLAGSSGGKCAGYVHIEANQNTSNNNNFYFPFDKKLCESQKKYKSPNWGALLTNITHSIEDVKDLLSMMKPNEIYDFALDGLRRGQSGHAICIKKINNNKGIQLFDPNFGKFSFNDENNFLRWLPFLIAYYCNTSLIPRGFTLYKIANQAMNKDIISSPNANKISPDALLEEFKLLFDFFEDLYFTCMTDLAKTHRRDFSYIELHTYFLAAFSSLISLIDNSEIDKVKKFIQENNYCFLDLSVKRVIKNYEINKYNHSTSSNIIRIVGQASKGIPIKQKIDAVIEEHRKKFENKNTAYSNKN